MSLTHRTALLVGRGLARRVFLPLCASGHAAPRGALALSRPRPASDTAPVVLATSPATTSSRPWWSRNRAWQRFSRWVRDSGLFRWIADTLSLPTLIVAGMTDPRLLVRHLQAGFLHVTTLPYGAAGGHDGRTVSVFAHGSTADDAPVVVFVHGGAWGSGRPWMYRAIVPRLCANGFRVALVGYRVWPAASAQTQAADVSAAIALVRAADAEAAAASGAPPAPMVLVGHSSGAHLLACHMLSPAADGAAAPVGFLGLAGVFNLDTHRAFEAKRGLDDLSPMGAASGEACDARDGKLLGNSPETALWRRGALGGSPAGLAAAARLVHAHGDETVPPTQAKTFGRALQRARTDVSVALLTPADLAGHLVCRYQPHIAPVVRLALGDGGDESLAWMKRVAGL